MLRLYDIIVSELRAASVVLLSAQPELSEVLYNMCSDSKLGKALYELVFEAYLTPI